MTALSRSTDLRPLELLLDGQMAGLVQPHRRDRTRDQWPEWVVYDGHALPRMQTTTPAQRWRFFCPHCLSVFLTAFGKERKGQVGLV
jgi:hypothetical protein